MAMAVAVKDTPEATARHFNRLAVGSLAGTVYVLAIVAAAYAIPKLWALTISRLIAGADKSFVDETLMALTVLAAVGGLIFVGQRLIGMAPARGLRAGIFVGVVGVLLIAYLTRLLGFLLEAVLGAGTSIGLGLTLLIALVLLVTGASAFFRATFENRLIRLEEQGWFTFAPYKPNQGRLVRRGTIVGILVLAMCGIYTLREHSLKTAAPNWEISLPFASVTGVRSFEALPYVQISLPVLLGVAALWIAYRIAHFPVFADFLIATEAELNKVSWTTRKRLVQDTIVVLTTVLLFTLFLFVVDLLWVKILSSSWIGVLPNPQATQEKKASPDEW
jgi:preprotein translocase SecE subunit